MHAIPTVERRCTCMRGLYCTTFGWTTDSAVSSVAVSQHAWTECRSADACYTGRRRMIRLRCGKVTQAPSSMNTEWSRVEGRFATFEIRASAKPCYAENTTQCSHSNSVPMIYSYYTDSSTSLNFVCTRYRFLRRKYVTFEWGVESR